MDTKIKLTGNTLEKRIENILKEGAARAREAASATLKRARHSCGITS